MGSEKKQPPQPGPAQPLQSLGGKFMEIYEQEGFMAAHEWLARCGGRYLDALRKRAAPVPQKPNPSPESPEQQTDDDLLGPHPPPALAPDLIDQAAWDKMLSNPHLGYVCFRAMIGASKPCSPPQRKSGTDYRVPDEVRGATEKQGSGAAVRFAKEATAKDLAALTKADEQRAAEPKDLIAACVIHPTHLNISFQNPQGVWFKPCVPGRENARGRGWDEWVPHGPSFPGVTLEGYCYDLCLRSATQFVGLASRFNSDVRVMLGDEEGSGKGITGLQMLICTERFAAPLRSPPMLTVKIRCFGAEDASRCLASLVALLESPFREAPAEPEPPSAPPSSPGDQGGGDTQ